MELGEKASIDKIVDERHDETCIFCRSTEPPKEMVNELTDEHDEDAEALTGDTASEYKFKNDAGKLGRALGGKPTPKTVRLKNNLFEAAVAAHHLIPGNASLKQSKLFLSGKYLRTEKMDPQNIGYNINDGHNGVWSPGNYGVRPWGTGGAEFQAKHPHLDPKDFAFAAMEAWGTQFHDAHEAYSIFVMDCLNKLCKKIKAHEVWCPEVQQKVKDAVERRNPLYPIVHRLHTISARMKRMLVFPTTNWKRNIYTSRFVEMYMDEKPHITKKVNER